MRLGSILLEVSRFQVPLIKSSCLDELGRLRADSNRLFNLLFTDEAHFHLCGGVNRHNWIMWADENPHWFDVRRLHSEKLTVWMGIGAEGVVGPFFWEREGSERGINARWITW